MRAIEEPRLGLRNLKVSSSFVFGKRQRASGVARVEPVQVTRLVLESLTQDPSGRQGVTVGPPDVRPHARDVGAPTTHLGGRVEGSGGETFSSESRVAGSVGDVYSL